MKLSFFSYAYLLSVYLLWWGVCSDCLPIFWLGCSFTYCWIARVLHIFWITVYQICLLQIFSPILCLSSHSLHSVICTFLILMKSSLSSISFMDLVSGVVYKKPLRASLVAQWLRICLLMPETRVRALVWEDPTCRGATRPVSHNYWACASGACAPQQERPQ